MNKNLIGFNETVWRNVFNLFKKSAKMPETCSHTSWTVGIGHEHIPWILQSHSPPTFPPPPPQKKTKA